MVGRKRIVYRVWEDIEAIVEEEYKDKYNEGEDTKLDGSADLLNINKLYGNGKSTILTYNPTSHI